MLKKILFACVFSLSFLYSATIENGKSHVILLKKDENAFYNNKQIPNIFIKNKKYAFIGIGYRDKKAKHITIKNKNVKKHLTLDIILGNYPKEELKVSQSKVKPSKKNTQRIKDEYFEAIKIYNTINPKNYIKKPFMKPLSSKITSPYGVARKFNDILKSYHSGTDFRAAIGTKIKASNDGVVVLLKNRFYAGNSIILDHGSGIYTQYYHLSKFLVKKGDFVKKGDIIALSGATGRITGPHLHFGLMLRGKQVDPMDFIEKINILF